MENNQKNTSNSIILILTKIETVRGYWPLVSLYSLYKWLNCTLRLVVMALSLAQVVT